MATVATYIPYSEINGGKPSTLDEFHKELSVFARKPLLRLCSALNLILRSDEEPTKQEAHDILVRMFFEPDLAKRLLRKQSDVRFVFYRQQMLFVAKSAALFCPDDGVLPEQKQFGRLGRLFLMAGDHLPNLGRVPAALDEKFSFLAAQLLPVQESSGFHRFDHKIARSYVMLSETAPKLLGSEPYFDIPKLFEDITGIPLRTFQSLLFASLTKFHKVDLHAYASDARNFGMDNRWFASTNVGPETLDRFFGCVSATAEELKEAYKREDWGTSDFTPFRDRPLLRDGNALYPIDFAFLAEKFETTPFWTVRNSLCAKERKKLHAFWGRVFEKYGYDLLHSAERKALNVVYESPSFADSAKGEVCDTLVVCGRSAALLELKGSTFSSRAKYASDHALLRAELDKKLVQDTDGRAKAVHQLNRSVALICDTKRPESVNGVDLTQVDKIFPVVVTRDEIGSTVGVNAYLQVRFDEIVQRKKVQKSVAPVVCLSAEDLERLTAYLHECSFIDLLSAHIRASKQQGRYLGNPYFAIGNNAILKKKGLRRPDVHLLSWHKMTSEVAQHLGIAENELSTP